MDKLTDEAIQRLLEQERLLGHKTSLAHPDRSELAVYRHLFKELGKDLPGGLPVDFSAQVVHQLQVRQTRSAETLFYVLLSAGAVLAFGLGFLLLKMLAIEEAGRVIETFRTAKVWLAFSFGFLVLFQLLDQLLVKNARSVRQNTSIDF